MLRFAVDTILLALSQASGSQQRGFGVFRSAPGNPRVFWIGLVATYTTSTLLKAR